MASPGLPETPNLREPTYQTCFFSAIVFNIEPTVIAVVPMLAQTSA